MEITNYHKFEELSMSHFFVRILVFLFLGTFLASQVFAAEYGDRDNPEEYKTAQDEVQKVRALQELAPIKDTEVEKDESRIKVIPLFDMTALGTFSSVNNSSSTYGFNVNAMFSPVIKFDEQNFLIPYYYGTFSEIRQIVTEDEGGRTTDIVSNHNASLEFKHKSSPNLIYRVKALSRYHLVKETGFDWGDGLYDYLDLGGGGNVEYFFRNDNKVKTSLTVGGEVFHRDYPNFQSLISLATATAPETNVKDYVGYRPLVRYKYRKRGFSARLLYSPIYKDFVDKKVIASSGILGNDERQDWFHYFDTDITFFPKDSFVGYNLNTTVTINKSNQNFNDSRSTPSPLDDVYTSDYYSYFSVALNPNLIFPIQLKNNKRAFVNLGYEYMFRDYDNRKVQTSAGAYTDQKQKDRAHTIKIQASYPLTDNVSLIALGNYTIARSNQAFETFYRYQYNSIYAAAGVRIKY